MSLIEQFPQVGTNGGGGASTTANNSWTGTNTFDGEVDVDGALTYGSTSLALNGGTQTMSATSALARITGSAAGSTVALPASPVAGQSIAIDNQASVSWTLSGNGINVDGSASKTVATAGPLQLWFTGSAWESLTWSQYALDARYLALGLGGVVSGSTNFTAGLTSSNALTINDRLVIGSQAASTASFTVVAGNAAYIESTYSPTGVQTITLPSAPSSQQVFWIVDEGLAAGTNNVTVSGNGKTINGASSIALAKNGAAIGLRYSGSAWFIFSAYNYP